MSNEPSPWQVRLPLNEHAERLCAYVLGMVHGQTPTPKQTKQAKAQAEELVAWCGAQWEDTPQACAELEERVYSVGWLGLWWKLTGNMDVFRETLRSLRDWEDMAGHNATMAITRGSRREDEEWTVVARAIADMEYQAIRQKSPRLEAAARVMRQILTPARLEPDAPQQNVRTQGARANAKKRHAGTDALRQEVLADWKKDSYVSKAECARIWAKAEGAACLKNPYDTIYRWLTKEK